jgi:hypothetical protein
MGVSLYDNKVAFNSTSFAPPEVKLFILIHESRHADQQSSNDDGFDDRYFNSVLSDNKNEFIEMYKSIEKDANDFAVKSMNEMGFDEFINLQEIQLRGNEHMGDQVFSMIKKDIQKNGSTDFKSLIYSQIL